MKTEYSGIIGRSVLLAEDDENDIFFMERAYKKAGLAQPLVVVRNGQEAIRYLEGEGIYAERQKYPAPCLVVLDLSMPIRTGFDVLEWLQHQLQPREFLPVIVLTSSSNPSDVQRALALGAADYRVKPTDSAELVAILRELQARWFSSGPILNPITLVQQHSTSRTRL